jgi:hypothetical protein
VVDNLLLDQFLAAYKYGTSPLPSIDARQPRLLLVLLSLWALEIFSILLLLLGGVLSSTRHQCRRVSEVHRVSANAELRE